MPRDKNGRCKHGYQRQNCGLCNTADDNSPSELDIDPMTHPSYAPSASRERMIEAAAKALCRLSYPARSLEEAVSPDRKLWQRMIHEATLAIDAALEVAPLSHVAPRLPDEPTDEMLYAAKQCRPFYDLEDYRRVWKAMIAAAPRANVAPSEVALGVITAQPLNTPEQVENAYKAAIHGRHINDIPAVLALRNKALDAFAPSSTAAPTTAVEMLIEDWEKHDRPIDSKWCAIVMRNALKGATPSATGTPMSELGALARDAARYRFLREANGIMPGTPGKRPIEWYCGTEADAAIDSAMNATESGGKNG